MLTYHTDTLPSKQMYRSNPDSDPFPAREERFDFKQEVKLDPSRNPICSRNRAKRNDVPPASLVLFLW